jgi:hypothetical protein
VDAMKKLKRYSCGSSNNGDGKRSSSNNIVGDNSSSGHYILQLCGFGCFYSNKRGLLLKCLEG